MARPTGSMVLSFSDRQAADFWSSDEEDKVEEQVLWDVNDELTEDSSDETGDEEDGEMMSKSRYTKGEALKILKEEKGDYSITTNKILKDVMGDSLEMLSSQTEKKKNKKLRSMKEVLRKLEKKRKDKKFRHTNELDDTFEKNSQSSLAELVKEEKGGKGEENEVEKPVKKKYRKPLDRCRDLQTLKDRTEDILETIRSEAEDQTVTEERLLAYLLYRVSYQHDRDLARKMFNLFRSGEWELGLQPVGQEKALALTERCRLGKGGFRYLHRQLKPHGLKMPYYPEVSALRRQVCPGLRPYTDMAGRLVGVTADLRDALQLTLRRHIQSGHAGYLETANCSLSVGVTIGFDGRGEKTEYKQKSQVGIDTSHSLSCQFMITEVAKLPSGETDCLDRNRDPGHGAMLCSDGHRVSDCVVGRQIGSDWRCGGGEAGQGEAPGGEAGATFAKIKKPFHYQEKDGVVWQERQLGSTWAARPLAIVMQRETREKTVGFVKNYLNPEVSSLITYGARGCPITCTCTGTCACICSGTAEAELEAGAGGGAGGCSNTVGTGVERCRVEEDWVLYSPRARRIVSRESCTTIRVDRRTVLQNPLPRRVTAGPSPPAKRATLEPTPAAAADTPSPPSPEVNI